MGLTTQYMWRKRCSAAFGAMPCRSPTWPPLLSIFLSQPRLGLHMSLLGPLEQVSSISSPSAHHGQQCALQRTVEVLSKEHLLGELSALPRSSWYPPFTGTVRRAVRASQAALDESWTDNQLGTSVNPDLRCWGFTRSQYTCNLFEHINQEAQRGTNEAQVCKWQTKTRMALSTTQSVLSSLSKLHLY